MTRFIFSKSNHLNTDISDEQGDKLYAISTWGSHQVTTIIKYVGSSATRSTQIMGVIHWHTSKSDIIQFQGKEMHANEMLKDRKGGSGRYFLGPDGQHYGWKLASHLGLSRADSDRKLVVFYERNLDILKQGHPAYLDISPEVVHMLDHIIVTFVYVEDQRKPSTIPWTWMLTL